MTVVGATGAGDSCVFHLNRYSGGRQMDLFLSCGRGGDASRNVRPGWSVEEWFFRIVFSSRRPSGTRRRPTGRSIKKKKKNLCGENKNNKTFQGENRRSAPSGASGVGPHLARAETNNNY